MRLLFVVLGFLILSPYVESNECRNSTDGQTIRIGFLSRFASSKVDKLVENIFIFLNLIMLHNRLS